jgi:hypothetical protein
MIIRKWKSDKVKSRREKREEQERRELELTFKRIHDSIEQQYPHTVGARRTDEQDIWTRTPSSGLWTRPEGGDRWALDDDEDDDSVGDSGG